MYDEDDNIIRVYGQPEDQLEDQSKDTRGNITMYIEPGEMTNAEKLKFKYRVEKFEDEKLTVQLTFENPGHVSATKEQDILTVKLKELRDLDDKLIVEDWTIKRPLPNQLDEETAAIIDFVVQVVIATAGTGLSFVFTQKLILG